MFILRSSKTHCKGDKPQIIKIDALEGYAKKKQATCPFAILSSYIKHRKKLKYSSEQFFVFRNRDPVKPQHVRDILTKVLEINNFEPSLYTFHGIRAGRATDLLEAGVSVETIKKLGRWKSSAVFTYLRS